MGLQVVGFGNSRLTCQLPEKLTVIQYDARTHSVMAGSSNSKLKCQLLENWPSDRFQDLLGHGKFQQFKVEVSTARKLTVWQVPGLTWLWWVPAIQSWSINCWKTDHCSICQDSLSCDRLWWFKVELWVVGKRKYCLSMCPKVWHWKKWFTSCQWWCQIALATGRWAMSCWQWHQIWQLRSEPWVASSDIRYGNWEVSFELPVVMSDTAAEKWTMSCWQWHQIQQLRSEPWVAGSDVRYGNWKMGCELLETIWLYIQ